MRIIYLSRLIQDDTRENFSISIDKWVIKLRSLRDVMESITRQ